MDDFWPRSENVSKLVRVEYYCTEYFRSREYGDKDGLMSASNQVLKSQFTDSDLRRMDCKEVIFEDVDWLNKPL